VEAALYAYVLLLGTVHVGFDYGKYRLLRSRYITDSVWTFLLDPALHGITVAVAAILLSRASTEELEELAASLVGHSDKMVLLLVFYVGVIFGGGHLVRYATRGLTGTVPLLAGETQEQLRNAGMYIGWLERFLILTALLLDSPAAVGLILTAKSIVRYPELKSVRFAEYFLIGTLLSISVAIVGGVLLKRML
jgi:hypothetical protein